MTEQDKAKGPGQRGRGDRVGFGGAGGGGFGGDRGGRGGGDRREGGRFGRDKREGGGGASFRVVTELSTLEKALTKSDFVAEKQPLEDIVKALKPLHLKSLEDLDLNARGRLITSLARVTRQNKPKPEDAPVAEAAPVEAAPSPEAAPAEGGETAVAAAPAEPAKPQVDPRVAAYGDVMFNVGLIWKLCKDDTRASHAFELAGRQPNDSDLASLAAPARTEQRTERPAGRGERPARPGDRRDARGERPRRDKPESSRPERPAPFVSTGDWKQDVAQLEAAGRTRDAARIHEKNESFVDAGRLFEAGGDLKSALRNAARAKNEELYQTLAAKLSPAEVQVTLEKAELWEKLMEFHVAKGDFESIAKLYERARQFDQAALAWERAGKFAVARKAYERVKDFAAANRVRDLEVAKLIERGDRLGAATLFVSVGRMADAVELLKALPGPKAFSFMVKLKLEEQAKAFAHAELAKAETEGNHSHLARWHELLGNAAAAAETWLKADRKDKASHVFEALGDLKKAAELAEAAGQLDRAQELFTKGNDAANAERVKALPRPPKKTEVKAETTAAEQVDAAQVPVAPAPATPTAEA